MAKKVKEVVEKPDVLLPVEKEDLPIERSKTGNLSERKSGTMSIQKYFRFHDLGVHKYMRAYAGERFRGIMKSKDEWEKEMKKIMGGNVGT